MNRILSKYFIAVAGTAVILLSGCETKDQVMDGDGMFQTFPYNQISQDEAKRMMEQDDGHVIVDVRRQDEYDEGHIPGAILIPNESIENDPPEELSDSDQIILVYCRSGRRSKEAAQKLADMGYKNVYEFGGIIDWTGDVVKENGSGNGTEDKESVQKTKSMKAAADSGKKSLAKRLAGKYSYHSSDENGNEEFYIMEVIPFGNNLYAYCGRAMPGDYERLEAYSFWGCEFIPYDPDEMTSEDGDAVNVNELRFSVMSNAGKYWDPGHKGTITVTDDGIVFEGFKNDDFLVPEYDDSRLFLKDDRVEDAFVYLNRDDKAGDKELQGLWLLDDSKGSNLYLEFTGSDLYMYRKDSSKEVFYIAGGCDLGNGTFTYTANRLGYGGMPLEMSCDYKVSGDDLSLNTSNADEALEIPVAGKYKRVSDGNVHVTTMDELEFDSSSFGMYGGYQNYDELKSQDYYGVFVSASKDKDECAGAVEKLEGAGFNGSFLVYTPDFSGLNPEPYYAATTGLYTTESDAKETLSEVKASGFADAYVKHAGTYMGDKYWYTMYSGENITVLKDGVMLQDVSLSIPYPAMGEPVKCNLLVSGDAVFDASAETGSFGNYEKGDTPYKWIIRNYKLMSEDTDRYLENGPALAGVFEVSLENTKITSYYGSYWWD